MVCDQLSLLSLPTPIDPALLRPNKDIHVRDHQVLQGRCFASQFLTQDPIDLDSPEKPRAEPHNALHGSVSTSATSSSHTSETDPTSAELPPLQNKSVLEETDKMEPLVGEISGSFDLVAPPEEGHHTFSLEERSLQMFSEEHLRLIFANSSSLLRFTAFLSTHRPQSVPTLIYYLDALKALKAIQYANAIAGALAPIAEHSFTSSPCETTANQQLEDRARKAFTSLAEQDLPAYITQIHIQIVSLSIARRITGNLAPHLRDASEGLAEVFCLTDPSRPDNPIVFASEGECDCDYDRIRIS